MSLPNIIQVEVTTVCQLRCAFCPRTALSEQWISAHMDWEPFSSLLPFVRRAGLVHLQGWGEPLLHPRLLDMGRAVKEKRGRASLTTNAVLLDEPVSRDICRAGFELVAVSIAGARPSTNDSLRAGSSLDLVCRNISYLCSLKPRPRVHLVMQMMKPNLDELPELVSLASRLGVDKVIAPSLDYIPTAEVDALRAFLPSPDPHSAEIVEEAKHRGKALGIEVHIYTLEPQHNIAMCDADPAHNVWISVHGEVAPCPYVVLPCKGDIPRLFWQKSEPFPRFSFGNVRDGLDRVLKGRTASSFRDAFSRRLLAGRLDTTSSIALLAMPRVCSSSGAFLEPAARIKTPTAASLPPCPEICRNCYKMYGI